MQIISYERQDRYFFCPVTGQPVYDDMGESVAPSFRALWVGDVLSEPIIHDPEFQAAWDAYLAEVEDTDDWIQIEDFLRSYDRKGWVAFEITTSGFACGPVSETSWTVLDLEFEVEEEGE